MYPTRYINEMKYDSRPKLFGYSSPGPVRAGALIELEGRTKKDYLLRHALKDCALYDPRLRLLDTWTRAGHWGVDRLFMRLNGESAAEDQALIQTVKNLYLLDLYFWESVDEEGFLDEAADFILSRSQTDGYLQFISRNTRWTMGEDPSVYRSDHWQGLAVAILVKFGIENTAVERFYDFLEREQKIDGGWLPEYYLLDIDQAPDNAPSHPLHTWSFATALSVHPELCKSDMFFRAVNYLLKNCFRRVGKYKKTSAARWNRLAEPFWDFNALNVLALAAVAGIGAENPEVKKIMEWLKEEQQKTSLWLPNVRRRSLPNEDLFLTLKATVTIKKITDDLGEKESE